jgi:hypothetical protein
MALRFTAWAVVMSLSILLGVRAWRQATRAGLTGAFYAHWTLAGFWLVTIIFSLGCMASELPRERRRRCESLAAQGRCGGCGYALDDLAQEADGCRVCPECGTAWRRCGAAT